MSVITTTVLDMDRDVSGAVTYGLQPAQYKYFVTLAANVEQNFTLPTAFRFYEVMFSFGGSNVWVAYDETAETPNVTIEATTSELNPATRVLPGGTNISFITADTLADIGFIFYAKQ